MSWKPSPAMLHFFAPLYNKITGKLVHGDSLSPLVSLEVNSSGILSSVPLTTTERNARHPPRYVPNTICQQHPFRLHGMASFLGFFCWFPSSVIASHFSGMSSPPESLRFSQHDMSTIHSAPKPWCPHPCFLSSPRVCHDPAVALVFVVLFAADAIQKAPRDKNPCSFYGISLTLFLLCKETLKDSLSQGVLGPVTCTIRKDPGIQV